LLNVQKSEVPYNVGHCIGYTEGVKPTGVWGQRAALKAGRGSAECVIVTQ